MNTPDARAARRSAFVGLMALAVLGGCASPDSPSEEARLLQTWGPPARVVADGDSRLLIYELRRPWLPDEVLISGRKHVWGSWWRAPYTEDSLPLPTSHGCTAVFEIRASRVVRSHFSGDHCPVQE